MDQSLQRIENLLNLIEHQLDILPSRQSSGSLSDLDYFDTVSESSTGHSKYDTTSPDVNIANPTAHKEYTQESCRVLNQIRSNVSGIPSNKTFQLSRLDSGANKNFPVVNLLNLPSRKSLPKEEIILDVLKNQYVNFSKDAQKTMVNHNRSGLRRSTLEKNNDIIRADDTIEPHCSCCKEMNVTNAETKTSSLQQHLSTRQPEEAKYVFNKKDQRTIHEHNSENEHLWNKGPPMNHSKMRLKGTGLCSVCQQRFANCFSSAKLTNDTLCPDCVNQLSFNLNYKSNNIQI
eukprot:Filipodium_phascolosomae@DN8263_c0_g1_i1.p1